VSRSGRHYPDRPIVGVGAVIVIDSTCAVEGVPRDRPDPYGIVLVRRRFEPLAGHWSLPGGMLEVGETLAEGIAREMLEETGLVVEVGGVIEVLDRIIRDDEPEKAAAGEEASPMNGAGARGRVRHHYVLIDYVCRPIGGRLGAGSDASDVAIVDPGALADYGVTPQVEAVVRRALEMSGR
jgi:ADP-ribose pyrophosphatase YjhB (NUDIX family)